MHGPPYVTLWGGAAHRDDGHVPVACDSVVVLGAGAGAGQTTYMHRKVLRRYWQEESDRSGWAGNGEPSDTRRPITWWLLSSVRADGSG